MEIVAEEWRSVERYEGIYEVSNRGAVRSVARVMIGKDGRYYRFRGRVLKGCKGKRWGYWSVSLCDVASQKSFLVHVIVANAFIGPKPEGREVNHKDGNKDNNCSENLEYVTASENCDHYIAMGLRDTAKGERHSGAKMTEEQVREIRRRRNEGETLKRLAQEFGVAFSQIGRIANRKAWQHVA